MQNLIPQTMQAVVQDEPNGPLFIREVPVPTPGPNQVLVRMHAAPINPSDLFALNGLRYDGKPRNYPYTPGGEGCGTVVTTGSGMMAKMLKGKFIACGAQIDGNGTWAEYMVTSIPYCIPLKKSTDREQGAMLIVNPLTAMSILEIAVKGKHKAIVNTVAASNLGGMILNLATKLGIPVINIVRRQDQMDIVNSRGGEYVLNSEAPEFETQLASMTEALSATLLLDAIGGEMTNQLAKAAPYGSTLLIYSNMSEEHCDIDPMYPILKNLHIEGWLLPNYLANKSLLQSMSLSSKTQKLLASDLNSHIGKRFPLKDISEGLDYYMKSMTGHKVLLNIGMK